MGDVGALHPWRQTAAASDEAQTRPNKDTSAKLKEVIGRRWGKGQGLNKYLVGSCRFSHTVNWRRPCLTCELLLLEDSESSASRICERLELSSR